MRRALLLLLAAWACAAGAAKYPEVVPGRALVFPRDHGAHPDFRIEWWYVTGWLEAAGRAPMGFQVTFFRVRNPAAEANPSAFAPRQILFAHAALADPRAPRLRHAERSARAGFGWAQAGEERTAVRIGDWSLEQEGDSYRAHIAGPDVAFDLRFEARRPPLLHGESGYSRKAPDPRKASYYYSRPRMAVTGQVLQAGRPVPVRGTAWLDHEWSSELLPDEAVGWDWTGVNLHDGGALMAFRLRDRRGGTLWASATRMHPQGAVRRFGPDEVAFAPQRLWRSPASGTEYPVGMRVTVADLALDLVPMMDDQELRTRTGRGAIYWEGAVSARAEAGEVGRGYLELTGYAQPLRLR